MNTSQELLGSQGPFAETLPGFQPRPAQRELAAEVEKAIASGEDLIAEAGTGTGKTLAYLVPALKAGVTTIISTGTRTLQDQLFFRDLPLVRDTLGVGCEIALLKGRGNYLCTHRMNQTRQDGRLESRTMFAELDKVERWSRLTRDGDLSVSNLLAEDSRLWPHVSSTVDNCLGSECPDYEECFVVRARRNAQEADVVVVNHHLLFADMAVKQGGFGEVLPAARLMILDEAHLVPAIATRFFSRGFSYRQIRDLHGDILVEAGEAKGALAVVKDAVIESKEALRRARAAFPERLSSRGGWARLAQHSQLLKSLEHLVRRLEELAEVLKPLKTASVGLESCHQRVNELCARWREISNPQTENQVSWYEIHSQSFSLHSTPLDISGPFGEYRQGLEACWIFTSATLTVKDSFAHFQRETGLEDARTFIARGGFDYRRNALVYSPAGLPNPNRPEYTELLMGAVWPLVEANGGRAFLLFSSHRALRLAAEWLDGRADFPLFIQGIASRTHLLEKFRESGNGVLLGAASFWEGVDVIGPALSLVVIDKLPFAPPDDPILEARAAVLKSQGENAFFKMQLPQAVIALKQGAGRLIRDGQDRGVLVVGDPRLLEKSYGRVFLDSLPRMSRTRTLEKVLGFLEHINQSEKVDS